MEYLASKIIETVVNELIKKGTELTLDNVFRSYKVSSNANRDIYLQFIDSINSIDNITNKLDEVKKLLSTSKEYSSLFEEDLYPTQFSKRLDFVIYKMNECSFWREQINVESLGEYLGFASVNPLKQYYTDYKEPDYAFIEKIADKLGVDREWLKNGNEEPFKSSLTNHDRMSGILNDESFGKIEQFFFVMDTGKNRKIGVILKYDKFRYSYYPKTYPFHASIGGVSKSMLVSVYNFLRQINQKGKMPSGIYALSEEEFSEFFTGKVYGGKIETYTEQTHFLDDFIRLYKSEEEKSNYEHWHGKNFVDCQDIIKSELNLSNL